MVPLLKDRVYEAIESQSQPTTTEVQEYLFEKYGTLYKPKRISMYIYNNLKGRVKVIKRKRKENRYAV